MGSVSVDGMRIVFGNPALGWLAGFCILPEGLAAPYAHSTGGTAVTVGVLMAAVPLGTVGLAGLLGLCAAAMLTVSWAQLRAEVIGGQRP